MANDLNMWQGIGRLGKDVEARAMASGATVASFSIACGSKWKDKNSGEMREETEWVNLTAFGKLGDICVQYLAKGSQVYVSGRMKTDKYEKDGITRYSTKVIIDTMQMLGGKSVSQGQQQGRTQRQPAQQSRPAQQAPPANDFDDDIPF